MEELDPLTLITAAATFGLVFALWGVVTVLWAGRRAKQARKLEQRLDPSGGMLDSVRTLRLWHDGEQKEIEVPGEYKPGSFWERLDWIRKDAGFDLDAQYIILLLFASVVVVVALVYLSTGQIVSGVGCGAMILVLSWMYVSGRITRRTALFEQQLVDGLELSARALRAGHPMVGSFELIAEEIADPVGSVFGEICQQHQMGVSIDAALSRAAVLARNPDMRLSAASLGIQMRTGGNLADVVEGIAKVIRQRMRLSRRFRVLTAQTQLSKRILLAMPLLVFGALQLVNPTYMSPLFQTRTGNVLLGISISGLFLGWVIMNKMAELRS